MPQISHIKYSDIIEAWRFDAEYFRPIFLEMISNLEKKWYFILGENAQIKWWKRLPLGEDFSLEWVPYIRAEDIKNNFVEYENSPKISENLHFLLKNYQTKKNDVLITIVWNVGDVGIIKFDLNKCNLTENSCKINNLNWINADSFFILMLSKYWQNQIHREKVWTIQSKLALERIRRFKIPILSTTIQQKIKEQVQIAYSKKEHSKQLYQEAEDLLLTELGLKDHDFPHTLTFTTTKKEVDEAGRYDADYFQPKYEEIIEKIEKYKGGSAYLLNEEIKDKNFFPKEWIEYNYIALADISSQWYIMDHKKELGENLPTRARRLVKKWDVIISSIEWSLSSCAIIEDEYHNAIVSNGFFVLNSSKFTPETLLILMKSGFIQLLLKKNCSWTILTAISKDGLQRIKLPLLDPKVQQLISDKVQESFKLRNESKQLLEQAKQMVEDEIEKDTKN